MINSEQKEAMIKAMISEAHQERMSHQANQWRAKLDLDEDACLGLVAVLQLVLRHPQFVKTRSADNVRDLIDKLTRLIPPERPLLHRLVELGDNPAYDG